MNVRYFPGCTLRIRAKELDRYARACAEKLGVSLCEVSDWQCCGGVYLSARDEIATKLSSVRALIDARDAGQPLVSVCSACHNVLKQTNHAMQTDPEFAEHVNRYLAQEKTPSEYHGETEVLHYLELLRDKVGFDAVRAAVVKPLEGRKIAAYYGCMLLRPGKVMRMDDPENPRILEDLIRALGGEPVVYPLRNECCGGYVALEDAESAARKSIAVSESAKGHGAAEICTACPLCKYNLDKNAQDVKITYFTELLAEALGVKEDSHGE